MVQMPTCIQKSKKYRTLAFWPAATMRRLVCAILLLLLAVAQGEGNTESTHCSKPLPGVRKMLRGVDITKLDLVPLQVSSDDGFKQAIINFTCASKRRWQRSGSTESYQLPDQVWHAYTKPGGWLSNSVQIYKSSEDIKRTMKKNVNGEGSLWKFAFSASHSYKTLQNTISNTSRYISDVTAFESAITVDFTPRWVLPMDTYAQMFVNNAITDSFANDPSPYLEFIRDFGTHYFSSGTFGGFIRVVHKTNENYFYQRSEREVETNAKASFLKVISAHGGQVSGSTTVATSFSSVTSKTVHYFGGSTNLLEDGGITRWQPTVDQDPWLFSGTLRPISDLFSNRTKQASMEEAVAQYVMGRYLDELERLLIMGRKKTSSSVLTSLESRLTAMRALATLEDDAVASLGRDIERHLVVPSWFMENTKLCYKWRADGDGGQCGGGAARLLCAPPNTLTAPYRDDTDGRGGGCRMQWGIQTTGTIPSWFNQVKVCYRWYPDGDGGQCGGGAARLLCANMNSFSPEYRDDSDGRGGGCRMSWRIVVPSSSPLWLQKAKMCFTWYPDGDGGQCGPAQFRNMCATANAWTPYYRDDTDGRGGGCRMRWGIQLSW